MRVRLIIFSLLAAAALLPQPGRAQSLAAGESTPPTRRWIVATGLWHSIGSVVPNLRIERVVQPHLSVLLDGAYLQQNQSFGQQRNRSTIYSISAGARYYFAATTPQGFYTEALAGYEHGRGRGRANDVDYAHSSSILRPEVGAGYHVLLGRSQRLAVDLGGRASADYLLRSTFLTNYRFTFSLLPTIRVGLAL